MEEESIKDNTGQIEAQLPVNVATYLLNEKRNSVRSVEKRHSVQLVIIPNPNMETPQYSVARRRPDDAVQEMSYNLPLIEQEENITDKNVAPAMAKEQPALQSLIAPEQKKVSPAAAVKSESIFDKASKWISGLFKAEEIVVPKKTTHTRNQSTNPRQNRNARPDRNKRNSKNHERKEVGEQSANRNERPDKNDRNERSDRKPKNDNRKPRRDDKPVDATQDAAMATKPNAPAPAAAPAKKKEQVAERRKRRDTRRSVRVDDINDEQNKVVADVQETQAAIIENPETVVQNDAVVENKASTDQKTVATPQVDAEPASETTDTQAVSDTNKDEESTPRTRSRRSPRHIRAAGQKRRKEGDEKDEAVKAETTDVSEVTQDELQFDEPVAAPKVEKTPEVVVADEKPEQVAMELTSESVEVVDSPNQATQQAEEPSSQESKAAASESEKEDIVKPIMKEPAKKTPKKATSLKVTAKPVKKESVSAPMARPASIDDAFVDVKIGSLDDAARPEVKRSGKSAVYSSSSNAAAAPATRPGSQSE
jgi:ribonuclease E